LDVEFCFEYDNAKMGQQVQCCLCTFVQ